MAWYDHLSYGDPVVCVDAYEGSPIFYGSDWPLRENAVYLFERCEECDPNMIHEKSRFKGALNLVVGGIENPSPLFYGFSTSRFRPAQTSDLPVSLTECLNTPVKKEEREHV